jgi:aspartate racemase
MKQHRTIGIVGGMSPESTVIYYQRIVRRHQSEFQEHNYPRIVIASVSFQKYIDCQHLEAWDEIARGLEKEFRAVAAAGADFAVLATNTMHKVLPSINSPIPVLNIMDVISSRAKEEGIRSVGLTGTKFTMSDGFYAQGLEKRGLRTFIPDPSQQELIHRIIYDELIFGKVEQLSAEKFADIAESLRVKGADAILLGCTELVLLTEENQRFSQIRTIDSTRLHAEAAWEMSVGRSTQID